MSKALLEIRKRIDEVKKKLNALREECDRLDANHANHQSQIQRDIRIQAEHLESLMNLERIMTSEEK